MSYAITQVRNILKIECSKNQNILYDLWFRFPMDIQVCRMRAESFGYNVNDVVFAWTQKEQVDMAQNLTLPQFSIKGHRYISCTKVSSSIWSCPENERYRIIHTSNVFSAIYKWDLYMHRSSVHIKTRNWLLFDSNLHSEFTDCGTKVSHIFFLLFIVRLLPKWTSTGKRYD